MVDVAEMIFRSALTRTESRGTHERLDYAESDPKWLKNVMVRRVEDQTVLSADAVTLSYVKPQSGDSNA